MKTQDYQGLAQAHEIVTKTVLRNTKNYEMVDRWNIGVLAEPQSLDDYLILINIRTPAVKKSGKVFQIGISKYPISSATYQLNKNIDVNICTWNKLEYQIEMLEKELNVQT